MSQIEIRISQLLRDMEHGLTRFKSTDQGFGSIEEKYAMSAKEVDIIFRHPKLKDVHPTPFRFKLVDDTEIHVYKPEESEMTAQPVVQHEFVVTGPGKTATIQAMELTDEPAAAIVAEVGKPKQHMALGYL